MINDRRAQTKVKPSQKEMNNEDYIKGQKTNSNE